MSYEDFQTARAAEAHADLQGAREGRWNAYRWPTDREGEDRPFSANADEPIFVCACDTLAEAQRAIPMGGQVQFGLDGEVHNF